MRAILKWVLRLTVVLVVLVVVAFAAGFGLLNRTVQPADGTTEVAGLSAPVTIVRDKEGIPHIDAKSRNDAFMALGYAHAQDRLWQMEMLRMAGQGRLSEMFGAPTKDTDIFLRTLGLFKSSRESLKVLRPDTVSALQAYADGINAFLNRKPRLLEMAYPPEFLLLSHTPEQWAPEHSVLVLKVMSLQLSMNLGREINRLTYAVRGFSPAEIDDLVPYINTERPPELPNLSELLELPVKKPVAHATPKKMEQKALADMFVKPFGSDVGWASNNWVVAGNRTESGKPLLANDPHLGYTAPSTWYLAHLRYPGKNGKPMNLIGASLPATPLVVLGRNDHIAWGFTNAGADVQDLFLEKLHEKDDNRYLTPDGWADLTVSEETVKIKGAADVTFQRRLTRHGPILPRSFNNIGDLLPEKRELALQWTALSDKDTSLDGLIEMFEAKTIWTFRVAARSTVSPMQAIVVADFSGAISLIAPAEVPLRNKDNKVMGRAPVPGWDATYDWTGKIPFNRLPWTPNPPTDAIGTANSKFVPIGYFEHITFDWDELFRHDRVQELIVLADKKHSVQTMKDGQLDIYSPALVALRDVFLQEIGDGNASHREVISQLKDWDGRMSRDSSSPLIMMAWFRSAIKEVFGDDLGDAFARINTANSAALLKALKEGGSRDWCDSQTTKSQETCAATVETALGLALIDLRERYGADQSKWRWGAAHITRNEHRPFGLVAPLSGFFNIDVESDGGSHTLKRGRPNFKSENPFHSRHGAGYRAIYDFSDLDKSLYIQTTGQSGHFLSPLYRNMAQRWADGEYITMSTKPDDYVEDALGTLTLNPAQ
ncbi:MAG: penicillin acylase family protein [Pseudomonadota bacterium]